MSASYKLVLGIEENNVPIIPAAYPVPILGEWGLGTGTRTQPPCAHPTGRGSEETVRFWRSSYYAYCGRAVPAGAVLSSPLNLGLAVTTGIVLVV